jgi:hypothetical protein
VEVLSDVLRESWLMLTDSSRLFRKIGLGHRVTERPSLIKNLYFPISFFEKLQ